MEKGQVLFKATGVSQGRFRRRRLGALTAMGMYLLPLNWTLNVVKTVGFTLCAFYCILNITWKC